MRKILMRYHVDPAFLRVLFSFGGEPNVAESGSSNIAHFEFADGSCGQALSLLQIKVNHAHQPKISPTKSDTRRKIKDGRKVLGLFGKWASIITTRPIGNSISSYSFMRWMVVSSRNNLKISPNQIDRHTPGLLLFVMTRSGFTFCHIPATWAIGDGISGLWEHSFKRRFHIYI